MSSTSTPTDPQATDPQATDPQASSPDARVVRTIDAIPVLPLTSGVVLPGMVVTVALETPEATVATDAALAHDGHLVLVPRTEGRLAAVGALTRIETSGELPDGRRALVIRALSRVRIGTGVISPRGDTALWVQAQVLGDTVADHRAPAIAEAAREYRAAAELVAEHRGWGRIGAALAGIDNPSQLADTIAEWPELSHERRVELLETVDPEARVRLATSWLREALAEQELKDKIRKDVTEGMEKQQRDFLLRQQLAAIRKELGDGDDAGSAVAEFRDKLETLEVPGDVRSAIERELDRLERVGEQSMENSWIRNWLDTVFDLPWGHRTTDRLDVAGARAILDADTTGLDEAKDRIVEWLAVRSLRAQRAAEQPPTQLAEDSDAPIVTERDGSVPLITPVDGQVVGTGDGPDAPKVPPASTAVGHRRGEGAILVLVGPPGVGKTSLGESVARALGRSFVRIALGGIRDEAEIRGHRRTYVGAQSGRIVKAMREAKSMNPVVLLDEIDKLAQGWSGDPAAALLEVLDPAQNHTFRDHYLEVDLDLSDVVFLATANALDSIPGPLLDRMELIPVDGYTDLEKVDIARRHLLPRQLDQHGLTDGDLVISDDALRAVIEGYTREAGVRSLERQIAKVLRKVAVKVTDPSARPVLVESIDHVVELLGRPKRQPEEIAGRVSVPGVATGLAVTGTGGDVLFVETTAMASSEPNGSGDPALTITGQLGDVMQESARIALSYVQTNAAEIGIDATALAKRRIHVHFPAGAVPKDGPSAGITMTTALVSLLTGRTVRTDVAMTGEVTLQGRVLPIGGVKQKLLAAHRAGVKTVIIPARNEPDLDDVPESVRSQLDIHAVSDMSEVLALALS
jgi:ATP-dependent Lon protease